MNILRAYLDGERGRQARLSEALRISPSAISMWPRVPSERVLEVERLTGISRTELRPDLYPASDTTEAA